MFRKITVAIAVLALGSCTKPPPKGFQKVHVTYQETLPLFLPGNQELLKQNEQPADLWMGIIEPASTDALRDHSLRGATATEMVAFNAQHPETMARLEHVCAAAKLFPTAWNRHWTYWLGIRKKWLREKYVTFGSEFLYPQMSYGVRTGMAKHSCDYYLVVAK